MSTHAIQQTSLFAFCEVKKSLGAKQQAVYEVIKKFGPLTNRQIKDKLGWEVNSVTGRCKELRDLGMVKEHEVVKDVTGRTAIAWKII